ncbi:hypothetical protein JTE90_014826 [Oedothorax gibbosus]|uniref:Uncharacterized protein n=1 Tax=Oedothorax gibbosus TaxID=931172 RepID=A0AAV6UBH3_9ARAC|nr:hypothetical protein JTE90_014826 [Oedothorax gibbosus]
MDLVKAERETYFSNQVIPVVGPGSITSSPGADRRMRLPKIELSPFGGDLKDYLGFWSQFQRHSSEEIKHFWDMEILGIKEPVEKAPREAEVMKFFNDTLSTDIDERYMESKWWEGPQWLKETKGSWPNSEEQADEVEVAKERGKQLVASNVIIQETAWYLRRFTKYSTIVRVVAWILRFGRNCRQPNYRVEAELTVDEIHSAEQKLLGIVQQERFSDTISKNKLKGLNAFCDTDGLLRVKTKILRREYEESFKCPIVLPSDHP